MFNLLTRIKSALFRNEGSENALPAKEIEPVENKREQMVESFRKMNTFKGKSVYPYSVKILSFLAREKEISQGAFFVADIKDDKQVLKLISGYAMSDTESVNMILEFGEGFPGQVAKDGKLVNITNIPEGYLTIESGLGKASPSSLILFPVRYNDKVIAVIELASFREFTRDDELYFEDISPLIAEQIVKCSHG